MKSIVAVDEKWGIGKNNDLLFNIKADMRHFVEHTRGKIVVMGSNTLRSLPGGMPLKNRINIVLNPDGSDADAEEKGYILVRSRDQLLAQAAGYEPDNVYVIGGAMMYRTLLPYCSEAIVTKVRADGGAPQKRPRGANETAPARAPIRARPPADTPQKRPQTALLLQKTAADGASPTKSGDGRHFPYKKRPPRGDRSAIDQILRKRRPSFLSRARRREPRGNSRRIQNPSPLAASPSPADSSRTSAYGVSRQMRQNRCA